MNADKAKKSLESVVKELQNRLEQTEENMHKGGKRALQKLEEKVCFWNCFLISEYCTKSF